ncbi:FG-GAP repeat domain-containing protein [Streptomyces sp. NPDC004266]|uniref:FG-GAP repeat domain-containing protein n=1 Tax=Streptomyces sp. NPDC004266 TaxID=3364693 RepID=UPI0036CCAF66
MSHVRPVRRRLFVAVTAVLAVTLGAGVLTAPATAAPTGVVTGTAGTAATAVTFPKNFKVTGAGITGFLSQNPETYDTRWTSYATGASTGYSGHVLLRSSRTTDYLVFVGSYQVTLRNLSTMSALDVPVGFSGGGAMYVGAAADAVFTTVASEDGGTVLRKHTKEAGAVAVTGLPAGATAFAVGPGTPDDALVTFTVGTAKKWGLLDLATGVVDEIRDRPAASLGGDVAVSATRVAWTESTAAHRTSIVVLDRATGTAKRIPLADVEAYGVQIGLVGDRVVYGDADGLDYGAPSPLYALTAVDPATGAKVRLLDHLTSSEAAPDGSLMVRGGTVARGEGLYRITADGAGNPLVSLVAPTGEPTKVVIGTNNVPAVVDFDKTRGRASFTWNLSRTTVDVRMTVRHVRTGLTRTQYDTHPYNPWVTMAWDGELGPSGVSAPNGDYTWTVTATPLNGIGPAATASGTFKVVRKAAPHDFNDNGTPDVLARDAAGRLWRHDSNYSAYANNGQLVEPSTPGPALLGTGWNVYDRIEAVGNVGGSGVGDFVARDKTGVLWLFKGRGDGTFAGRIRIGGGWNTYDRITGGSDFTGDGRSDLVGIDKAGVLWLYRGTGLDTAPYSGRVKLGVGFGIYDQITAVGNIAGGTAGDLVARDRSGVLWSFLGDGRGGFVPRTRIGAGFGAYDDLIGVGDANRDGRNDLYVHAYNGDSYLFRGSNDWRAPFQARQLTGVAFAYGYSPVA